MTWRRKVTLHRARKAELAQGKGAAAGARSGRRAKRQAREAGKGRVLGSRDGSWGVGRGWLGWDGCCGTTAQDAADEADALFAGAGVEEDEES